MSICINWQLRKSSGTGRIVSFDNPEWEHDGFETDIEDDIYFVLDEIISYNDLLYKKLRNGEIVFDDFKQVLIDRDCDHKKVSDILIERYENDNEEKERKIRKLDQEKLKNELNDKINIQLGSLPQGYNSDKIMKYEKTIQKSILQNLVFLKKLQAENV